MRAQTPQAVSIGSLGRSRIVTHDGHTASLCGRCGGKVAARRDGQVRYCRDCIRVDPVFCGWVKNTKE